nr:hypothetical protein Q903MT_gene1716 [Picea sitchensis]
MWQNAPLHKTNQSPLAAPSLPGQPHQKTIRFKIKSVHSINANPGRRILHARHPSFKWSLLSEAIHYCSIDQSNLSINLPL